MKYTKIFHPKAFQNIPKLEFWVLKYNIWQPCGGRSPCSDINRGGPRNWELYSASGWRQRKKGGLKSAAKGRPGVPDGLFSDQKFQFWFIFIGLGMENLGIFYGHLGTFKSIWYIFW
jgi:hypothetical protein